MLILHLLQFGTLVRHTHGKNTSSNSPESSVQILHVDLECSTVQLTFQSINASLTRSIMQPKNEEKDINSSNASLFTFSLFRIQLPNSCERHTRMGVMPQQNSGMF